MSDALEIDDEGSPPSAASVWITRVEVVIGGDAARLHHETGH